MCVRPAVRSPGEIYERVLMMVDNNTAEQKLAAIRQSMRDLMAESYGVAGLHLNGEVATWDWLIENNWLEWMGDDE